MTKHMPSISGNDRGFECLDPALGGVLWRLDDPSCPDELRERLQTHVTFCADCRLTLATERHTAAGLRDGSLAVSTGVGWRRRVAPWAAVTGAAALAAGLALLVLLPPSAPHEEMTLRGEDGPAIERPVAEEVVLDRHPTVRWTDLPKARTYTLTVEAVGGDYRWTTNTDTPAATVPAGDELPADTRFRVRVEPVPAHAAPDGALRSSFRTGGPGAWLAHRLRHGPDTARGLGGAGLLGLVAGLAGLLRSRRNS